MRVRSGREPGRGQEGRGPDRELKGWEYKNEERGPAGESEATSARALLAEVRTGFSPRAMEASTLPPGNPLTAKLWGRPENQLHMGRIRGAPAGGARQTGKSLKDRSSCARKIGQEADATGHASNDLRFHPGEGLASREGPPVSHLLPTSLHDRVDGGQGAECKPHVLLILPLRRALGPNSPFTRTSLSVGCTSLWGADEGLLVGQWGRDSEREPASETPSQ